MCGERMSELVQTYGTLYEEFFRVDGMHLYLDLLPLLAQGSPVSFERLAEEVGRPKQEVANAIRSLPDLEYDAEGRVVGAGLTLEPTRHRFRLDDLTLYTWCAWDALIYPPMLDRTAEVESTCPATGDTIRMTVTPDSVEDLEPRGAVLSFPEPDLERACYDVRAAFCDRSNVFRSAEVAREWLEGRDEVDILTVDEGFGLGRRLCVAMLASREEEGEPAFTSRSGGSPSPIACRLSRDEKVEWTERAVMPVLEGLTEIRELEDGFAFRFSQDEDWKEKLQVLTDWIGGERECCPFFRFEVVLEAEKGPLWLHLRGRPGVKDYIAGGLGLEVPGGFDLSGVRRS